MAQVIKPEKRYRFRISFTAEVEGKDETDALGNAVYGLNNKWPFLNVHNTKTEAKGYIPPQAIPADEPAKEELPTVTQAPEVPTSDNQPF